MESTFVTEGIMLKFQNIRSTPSGSKVKTSELGRDYMPEEHAYMAEEQSYMAVGTRLYGWRNVFSGTWSAVMCQEQRSYVSGGAWLYDTMVLIVTIRNIDTHTLLRPIIKWMIQNSSSLLDTYISNLKKGCLHHV